MIDKDYVCGEYSDVKEWHQIRATVKLPQLDMLTAIMSMLSNNLMIEDYSDIDLKTCYGDLIDESILNADKTVASVSVFLPCEKNYNEAVDFIRARCAEEGIAAEIEVVGVNEEDWANSWKEYYKPLHIGEKIVIVPAWERYDKKEGEVIVTMDPGMAFGTGTHETTRLVIGLLERYTEKGSSVLDVGTGSGILAICASKLGAGQCYAYDIDPVAVRVAKDNIESNACDNIVCEQSDLLKSVEKIEGGYDLVTANIVADIILRMIPDVGQYMHENTILLASGIIAERADDVVSGFEKNGFQIVERVLDNGWCALAVKKAK
ncbi:MAG: 50S ribosomal protein L11 methyltransferase [Ruminococcaceae bacterium]|nr:50S ribosomal protein L11 methyltransferase [Oscillospiraceae bacterium]